MGQSARLSHSGRQQHIHEGADQATTECMVDVAGRRRDARQARFAFYAQCECMHAANEIRAMHMCRYSVLQYDVRWYHRRCTSCYDILCRRVRRETSWARGDVPRTSRVSFLGGVPPAGRSQRDAPARKIAHFGRIYDPLNVLPPWDALLRAA